MPTCFICKESFPFISTLCKHFQIKHATHDFVEHICIELNCDRSFHLLNSYKKHLATHLKDALISTVIEESTIFTSVNESLSYVNYSSGSNINSLPIVPKKCISTTVLDNFYDFRLTDNHIGKFLASLYSNPQIPRNVIQLIIEGMTGIIEGIKQSLLNSNLIIPHNISDHIKSVFENIDTTFSNLNIEYKRIKYYTEKGSYIAPQEYVVGERLNDNRNQNTFSIIPTNCTAQFIPTRHVLKIFFDIKDILSDTFDYINKKKSCDTILMNFIQGSL